ncbi:MAG: hypothetical protein H5T69_10010, partial [Chloroflexi bacterium]|nr:hypothetical protein [Chloroflexota bacterium]
MSGMTFSRRVFLTRAAALAGVALLLPAVASCAPKATPAPAQPAPTQPVSKPEAQKPAPPELVTLRYLAYQGR